MSFCSPAPRPRVRRPVPRQSPYVARPFQAASPRAVILVCWLASAQATGQETRATAVALRGTAFPGRVPSRLHPRLLASQRPGHGSGDPCHAIRKARIGLVNKNTCLEAKLPVKTRPCFSKPSAPQDVIPGVMREGKLVTE
jgi:hypothetical protein